MPKTNDAGFFYEEKLFTLDKINVLLRKLETELKYLSKHEKSAACADEQELEMFDEMLSKVTEIKNEVLGEIDAVAVMADMVV